MYSCCTHTFVLLMHSMYICMHNTRPHPCTQPRNRVSGVEEYDVRDVHPGVVSVTLTMQTYSFYFQLVTLNYCLVVPWCEGFYPHLDVLQQKMTCCIACSGLSHSVMHLPVIPVQLHDEAWYWLNHILCSGWALHNEMWFVYCSYIPFTFVLKCERLELHLLLHLDHERSGVFPNTYWWRDVVQPNLEVLYSLDITPPSIISPPLLFAKICCGGIFISNLSPPWP